jgi:hypothetical protein
MTVMACQEFKSFLCKVQMDECYLNLGFEWRPVL